MKRSADGAPSRFSLQSRLRSFVYAWRGVKTLLQEQHNARIHLLAIVCVLCLGAWLGLSVLEWALVLMACALVFGFEALNSALEYLCDRVEPERDPLIRKAKDVSAAAVLIAAIAAALIGLLVFLPKLLALL